MKKNILFLKLLLMSILISACSIRAEKHVIGDRNYAGFFSNFFGVLNHIQWCQKNNTIPVVYWNNSLYQVPQGYNDSLNPWEYYFELVSSLSYHVEDMIDDRYIIDGFDVCNGMQELKKTKTVSIGYREWVKNTLIDPYITVKPQILKKINMFYQTHMQGKKTVGIHLRGTDKCAEEPAVDPLHIIEQANQYAEQGYQFFVATDENRLLELAKTHLKGNVIFYNSYRSDNNQPIHAAPGTYSKAKIGEEVLIEMLLLSRCNTLIHTVSNVSYAVLLFNPYIENILLQKLK